MTWQDVPGWFDTDNWCHRAIYEQALVRGGGVFVEVGVWFGRSIIFLAQEVRRRGLAITVYGVDTWAGCPIPDESHALYEKALNAAGGDVYPAFLENLRACGVEGLVRPIRRDSVSAAERFADGAVDFVFLDAGHGYASVFGDLRAWWPKLRPGGLFAGHDYSDHWPGVRQAVGEFFGRQGVPFESGEICWQAEKPKTVKLFL